MEKTKNKKESLFKITLKNKSDSSNNPTQGDFTKFKIGDKIVRKAYDVNTIYEIVGIKRVFISNPSKNIIANNDILNMFLEDGKDIIKGIIKGYVDNNMFGECQFELKPVIKSGKLLNDSKKRLFLHEIETVFSPSLYYRFDLFNVQSAIEREKTKFNTCTRKINNYKKHITYNEKRIDVISEKIEMLKSILPVSVEDDSELPF